MFVDLTPEQHALRLKVRDYFQNLMTPQLREQLRGKEGGPLYRDTIRQMGRDGWLAVGWPKEHGGQGYGPTEQFIFFEEANIAGAPLPFVNWKIQFLVLLRSNCLTMIVLNILSVVE